MKVEEIGLAQTKNAALADHVFLVMSNTCSSTIFFAQYFFYIEYTYISGWFDMHKLVSLSDLRIFHISGFFPHFIKIEFFKKKSLFCYICRSLSINNDSA